MVDSRIKPLSEDFIGTIAESKIMVSRSLEKMMLIAIGLSTAVIVGVPVLMYAIDTINTTNQLQEVQLAAEQIHNATMLVDSGTQNATTINVSINPGVTVTSEGNTLTVWFVDNGGNQRAWGQTYSHEVVIVSSISSHQDTTLYIMEVDLIDNVIYLSFYQFPI